MTRHSLRTRLVGKSFSYSHHFFLSSVFPVFRCYIFTAVLSRYYNGDLLSYTEDHLLFLREYFLAQLDSYEKGQRGIGWFMWTIKTAGEGRAEWDFLNLWKNGIIPQDLCNREHYCY